SSDSERVTASGMPSPSRSSSPDAHVAEPQIASSTRSTTPSRSTSHVVTDRSSRHPLDESPCAGDGPTRAPAANTTGTTTRHRPTTTPRRMPPGHPPQGGRQFRLFYDATADKQFYGHRIVAV